MATKPNYVPLTTYRELPEEEMHRRASDFADEMHRRRTVRQFSDRPVSHQLIDNCIRAAGSAPSGATLQPWHFVVVTDSKVKQEIRVAAEHEEEEFYTRRAPQEWLDALAPIGTDSHKPFLEEAPALIAVFAQHYGHLPDGRKVKHYYPIESVGLATGILITALHHCGLASLTHTPSPMAFLNRILNRPKNERPFLLLVTGYPQEGAEVPDIHRKDPGEIVSYVE